MIIVLLSQPESPASSLVLGAEINEHPFDDDGVVTPRQDKFMVLAVPDYFPTLGVETRYGIMASEVGVDNMGHRYGGVEEWPYMVVAATEIGARLTTFKTQKG